MIAIVHCGERTAVQRRALVIGGFAAAVGCSVSPVARAATSLVLPRAAASRTFSIMYKGSRIGTHAVSYSSTPGEMLVKTEIHLEAKLAFFPAYALSHRSEEAWRAGRLMSLSSETVEQGERLGVEGVATPQGFRVLSKSGPFIASARTLTSNDLWTPALLEQAEVVDARRGGIIGVNARKVADESIVIAGRRVEAICYEFITPYYAGNIWYDHANLWVHGEFERDGSKVQYQLVET
jgi:Family of unknown function (DUF6134)